MNNRIVTLVIIVFGFSIVYSFVTIDIPKNITGFDSIGTTFEAPGWQEDLKIFKYNESDDVPDNLKLYYHKLDQEYRESSFRNEGHLSNVI